MKLFGGKQDRDGTRRRSRIALPLLALCLALAALGVSGVLIGRLHRAVEAPENAAPPSLRPAVTQPRAHVSPPPEEEAEDAMGMEAEAIPDEPTPAAEIPAQRRDGCETFVLLGRDCRSSVTDTVLVGRWDAAQGMLNAVSIPRDTLVNVSWELKKINTVYGFSERDPERVLDDFGALLGFRPDHYAVVDDLTAAAIVDAVGGIDYNVLRDMDFDDPAQDLHIHIRAGLQHLNGEDTVGVLRFRVGNGGTGYPDGDLGRIRTQQDLLSAAARQFLASGIPHPELAARIFAENADSDLDEAQLLRFAEDFQTLAPESVSFYTAPGQAVSIRGGYYYQLDPEGWAELINAALNPLNGPILISDLDVLREMGESGAVSTTGESVPMEEFFNFYDYNS